MNTRQFDHGCKVGRCLLKASGNSSRFLEPSDQIFDDASFLAPAIPCWFDTGFWGILWTYPKQKDYSAGFLTARKLYRLLLMALACVLCIALPLSQISLATAYSSVICCCGEHSVDDDCGCPDCPATVGNDQVENDDTQAERELGFYPCTGRTHAEGALLVSQVLLPKKLPNTTITVTYYAPLWRTIALNSLIVRPDPLPS